MEIPADITLSMHLPAISPSSREKTTTLKTMENVFNCIVNNYCTILIYMTNINLFCITAYDWP